MSSRRVLGSLYAFVGGVGLAGQAMLLYRTDEHNRELFSLGMAADLLATMIFILMLLSGLAMVLGSRDRDAGR
jgi:hypothetical protein